MLFLRGATGETGFRAMRTLKACVSAMALALGTATYDAPAAIPGLPLPVAATEVTRQLRATADHPFTIADAVAHFDIGESLLLFDFTPEIFVGIVRDEVRKTNKLVAVPRTGPGAGSVAWITKEKQIVFSSQTQSCPGTFTIHAEETLPILGERPDAYLVIAERFGRQARIEIPKSAGAFVVEDAPKPVKPVEVAKPRETASGKANETKPASIRVEPRSNPSSRRPAASTNSPRGYHGPITIVASKEHPFDFNPPIVIGQTDAATSNVPPVAVAPSTNPPPVVAQVVVTQVVITQTVVAVESTAAATVAIANTTNVPPVPAVVAPEAPATTNAIATVAATAQVAAVAEELPPIRPRVRYVPPPPPESTKWWVWLFLIASVVLATLIVLVLVKKKPLVEILRRDESTQPKMASSPSTISGSDDDVVGTIDGFPLAQIIRVFHMSADSGTIIVTDPHGAESHLILQNGNIIDARNATAAGLPVARDILAMRLGAFRFIHEDTSSRLRVIDHDTYELLSEISDGPAIETHPPKGG